MSMSVIVVVIVIGMMFQCFACVLYVAQPFWFTPVGALAASCPSMGALATMVDTTPQSKISASAGSPSQVLMQGDQLEGSSGLAKRVPRVRQGGDTGQHKKKVIERNCLVEIIDKLEEDRSMAPHVWNALDLNLISNVTYDDVAAHQAAFFPDKGEVSEVSPSHMGGSMDCADHQGRVHQ